jgi:rifampin ADP-ribosylating transferase
MFTVLTSTPSQHLFELGEFNSVCMPPVDPTQFIALYHGTKAQLNLGDLIGPGYASNYGERKPGNYVYLSATLNAATWGAELAIGEGRGRIYIVEPTGVIEDDPNLTDKKFPGNPTKSFRSAHPLRIVGEITDWQGHTEEELAAMHAGLVRLKERGIDAIEE